MGAACCPYSETTSLRRNSVEVKFDIQANCGCGFNPRGSDIADVVEAAIEHVHKTGHKLDLSGKLEASDARESQ